MSNNEHSYYNGNTNGSVDEDEDGPVEHRAEWSHFKALAITLRDVSCRVDLTSRAVRLATALASHYPAKPLTQRNYDVWPSTERLLTLCGWKSRTTLYRGIRELQTAGLLSYATANKGNRYKLLWLNDKAVSSYGSE